MEKLNAKQVNKKKKKEVISVNSNEWKAVRFISPSGHIHPLSSKKKPIAW